ncbi:MAG: FAD-binding domain-containing protein [Prochlorococcaceae cyanobacterium]
MAAPTILWFRRDLRIDDHPALAAACSRGPVLPLFILDPALLHHPETAVARVAFLLETLRALDADLRRRGGRLLVRQGDPTAVVPGLARAVGAAAVIAHSDSERILGRVRDARVAGALERERIPLRWIEPPGAAAGLLSYPAWRRCWHTHVAEGPLAPPPRVPVPPPVGAAGRKDGAADPLADLPVPALADLGLVADAKPLPPAGHAAAITLLDRFLEGPTARSYHWQLSYPAARATTGLSPYLKFGVISHRRCLERLAPLNGDGAAGRRSWRQLVSRLRWGAGMAQRFRYLPQLELRSLWRAHGDPDAETLSAEQEDLYAAWCEGRTGFPIVDAAMRCLLAEGGWWELNFRSRAISASFLTHLCGLDWRWGALHFMRHLIDGDAAIDHWQWAMQAGATLAGPGAWARIYHPGQVAVDRCDPQGLFIRRWCPELAGLTNDQLGQPSPQQRRTLGYPAPVLDYEAARSRRRAQLEEQASATGAGVEDLAALPASCRPFASDRFTDDRFAAAGSAWAEAPSPALLPAAADLQALDRQQRAALLSWCTPSRGTPPPAAASRQAAGRRRRREAEGQLTLPLPGFGG